LVRYPKGERRYEEEQDGPASNTASLRAVSPYTTFFESSSTGVLVLTASSSSNQRSHRSRLSVTHIHEEARLIYVLIDAKMASARRMLSRSKDHDKLDRQPAYPCDAHLVLLFNDESFKPQTNLLLSNGITASDVAYIDPSGREHLQNGSMNSEKRSKMKSE
jgi:hypothetical protein